MKTKEQRTVERKQELRALSRFEIEQRAVRHGIPLTQPMRSPLSSKVKRTTGELIEHIAQHEVAHEMMAEAEPE